MEALKNMLTEANNTTFCPVRLAGAATFVGYHGAAVAGLVLGVIHFDMDALGKYVTHMIELFGALGVIVTGKTRVGGDAK